MACSCHYTLYQASDINGKKHWVRGYKSYKLGHRYYDRNIIKYKYKSENYNNNSICVSKTDTTIDYDSIKIRVLKDSKQYATIFTDGIISGNLISKFYGSANNIPAVDEEIIPAKIDTGIKIFKIYSLHPLTNIKTKKGHRFFQFHISPYWFYFELTNPNAKRKTRLEDFIKGSHLSWFYTSNIVEI